MLCERGLSEFCKPATGAAKRARYTDGIAMSNRYDTTLHFAATPKWTRTFMKKKPELLIINRSLESL